MKRMKEIMIVCVLYVLSTGLVFAEDVSENNTVQVQKKVVALDKKEQVRQLLLRCRETGDVKYMRAAIVLLLQWHRETRDVEYLRHRETRDVKYLKVAIKLMSRIKQSMAKKSVS